MTHLHIHNSNGSRLDAIATSKEYAKKAKELGHTALATTDHGKCSNFFEHQEACDENGIKPIFGVEAYIAKKLVLLEEKNGKEKRVRQRAMHLVLLAKNEIGYKNILKLNYLSMKDEEHFYYMNRITLQELFRNKEGIIITSACLGGPIAQALLNDGEDEAEKIFTLFEEEFGEDFYPEIQINEIEEQEKVNKFILNMCDKYAKTPIIGGDVHYLNKGDDKYQLLSVAIRDKKTIDNVEDFIESKNLFYHDVGDYLKFSKEWGYDYQEEQIIKWCEETDKVAEKCNYRIPERKKTYLPAMSDNDDGLLIKESMDGLSAYLKKESFSEVEANYRERLMYELEVIIRKGFSSYLLILKDIFDFVKKEGHWYGPSRGCFTSENKVLMANGSYKNISNVKIGDKVISGKGKARICLDRFEYDVEEELYQIELENGDIIECTEDHKILTKDGVWKKACELTLEDELVKVKPNDV